MFGARILAVVPHGDVWVVFASNEHIYIVHRAQDGLYQWASNSLAYSDWGQFSGWYKSRAACLRHLARWLSRWSIPTYFYEGQWIPPREHPRDGVYWPD